MYCLKYTGNNYNWALLGCPIAFGNVKMRVPLDGSETLENLVSRSGIILIIKPITKLNIQQVKNNHPLNYAQIITFSRLHPCKIS